MTHPFARTILFTRNSTASTCHLFILRTNRTLDLCVGFLLTNCTMSHYIYPLLDCFLSLSYTPQKTRCWDVCLAIARALQKTRVWLSYTPRLYTYGDVIWMCSLHNVSSWCDIVTLALFCPCQRIAVQTISRPLLLFTCAKFHGIKTSCSNVTLAGNNTIACFFRQNIQGWKGETGYIELRGTSVLSWSG